MTFSEKELILMAQGGNSDAFEQLVYRYDKGVLSLALKYINDTDLAKDIYQEVFIRVYRGLKGFQFKSEFSTWIYRIATNVCLTHKEKIKNRKLVSINDEYENEEPVLEIIDEDPASSPEKFTAASELNQSIYNALKELPEKQKMAFMLKHFEGYKIKEIAVMMDCQEGTIKKYLFEAVHKLRNKLKEFSQ